MFLILIGIIIGIIGTVGFQEISSRSKPSYAEVRIIEEKMGIKVNDLSTDDLYIFDWVGMQLQVLSKKNPAQGILISSVLTEDGEQGLMSSISLLDQSGSSASFMDRNGDGVWDDIDFSKGKVTYGYGRLNGHPDMILTDNEMIVRIGDDYYKHQRIDGKHFIDQDGEIVEVEYTKHYQFKIKESEPIK